MISPETFGRDHLALLGYIACRTASHAGLLENQHMRCNPRRHRKLLGDSQFRFGVQWHDKYSSRLKDGTTVSGHDDWSCLEYLVAAGWVSVKSEIDIEPERSFCGGRVVVALTSKGQCQAIAYLASREAPTDTALDSSARKAPGL